MDPLIPKGKLGPEAIKQKAVLKDLRGDGWFARSTHGNEFQAGLPDIFACHLRYGSRWIEMKNDKNWKLEESQIETFTKFSEKRVGVWVLQGVVDVPKLLKNCNWWQYTDAMKHVTRSRARRSKPWVRNMRPSSVGPERDIQEALKVELTQHGWYVYETFGSIYQSGWPDLYACHYDFGARWIEVKNPTSYSFTPAQLEYFPLMVAHGCGVWVLTGAGQIGKLFEGPNWWTYLNAFK